MPYFIERDKQYIDPLIGKTVKRIEPGDSRGRVTFHWTDGTQTTIAACVEQERVTRNVNLIVNSRGEPKE